MTGVTCDGKRGVRTAVVKMIHLRLSNFWLETLHDCERLLLNVRRGIPASGGDEFSPGPETRLDRSELLCNKVLLKCKGDRESF